MDRPISGRGGRYLQRVDSYPAIALGIDLHLTPATEGGRSLPLLNLSDRTSIYRPNWGLPSMTPPEQSGAPVFAFLRDRVGPGESAHAVIVTLFPEMVDQWNLEVEQGVVLPMYEGARVRGYGTVLWREHKTLPLNEAYEHRFFGWLRNPTEPIGHS